MLIPGLPPAGTQQEVFKPDRKVRTTAAEGLAHEPLADLPVEQQPPFQHTGEHAGEESAATSEPESDSERQAGEANTTAQRPSELPRKGLVVDIRA